jgi:hypothetical protein
MAEQDLNTELDIDGMFSAILKNEKRKKEARKLTTPSFGRTQSFAEALVLCLMEIVGKWGETYTTPNSTLLLRRGKDYTKPKKWSYAYNYLRREVLIRHDTAQGCDKCFAGGYWTFDDVKVVNGKAQKNDS